MSNERHRDRPPPSKPQGSPAISSTDLHRLSQRLDALEKLVKDNFDEKNQWNSQVREWIGKPVVVQLVSDTQLVGALRWVDRYTLCVDDTQNGVSIVHKGAVAIIRQASTK